MIKKQNRLNRDKDITEVFKNKKKCYNKYVGVLIRENEKQLQRFVIIISNKTIKKAVDRNKIKRQIKSILAKHQNSLNLKVDMVLIVQKETENKNINEIEKDILFCFKKLKLIK